jgi:hypothetical protein
MCTQFSVYTYHLESPEEVRDVRLNDACAAVGLPKHCPGGCKFSGCFTYYWRGQKLKLSQLNREYLLQALGTHALAPSHCVAPSFLFPA